MTLLLSAHEERNAIVFMAMGWGVFLERRRSGGDDIWGIRTREVASAVSGMRNIAMLLC